MRFARIALGLALAITSMGALSVPIQTHPVKDAGPIAKAVPSGSPLYDLQKTGSSKSNPIYIAAQCENGCGFSEDHRTFIDKILTDPIAAFTVVLAISTIALWWVTKDMAGTSKRALLDLERPIVFGGASKSGLTIEGGKLGLSELELSIYNHGRTMARLRRLEWEVRVAQKGAIAPRIDPSKVGGRELPTGTACVSGDPYCERENLFAKWDVGTTEKIASGELSVWIVGFVRYEDVFQRHHISGFTQVFDPIGGRFVRRGGDDYNYEHSEQSKSIPAPSSRG